MKKVLFIINPLSGGTDKSVLKELIRTAEAEEKLTPLSFLTTGQNDTEAIQKLLDEFDPEIVAVAGGDGTLVMVADIIKKTPVKMVIIPMGSANGMAKELTVPTEIKAAFELINAGRELTIDLLSINNKTCLHLADVGLNAQVVKRFERDPRRGLWIYGKYVLRELSLLRRNRFKFDVDGVVFRKSAVSLIFANASRYGTGAVINPVGNLNDGKFELCIIKQLSFLHFINLVWKAFFGRINDSDQVDIISCSKAIIQARRKTLLQSDGEIIGKVKNIQIEIVPAALTLLVPSTYFNSDL